MAAASPSAPAHDGGDTFYQNLSVPFAVAASTISVNAAGTLVALGTKRGLYFLELKNPENAARSPIPCASKSATVSVQFSPLTNDDCALANDNRVLVYDVASASTTEKVSLDGHSDFVFDLDWSPFIPSALATCSKDSSVRIWDMRDARAPTASTMSVLSSDDTQGRWDQIKWNRGNQNLLASSHGGAVHVWDVRRTTAPLTTIDAHSFPVLSLDWSFRSTNELVTCSQDKMIKVWNVDTGNCKDFIQTGAPVAKARYTPFGDGLITTSLRQDTALRLWSLTRSLSAPTQSFAGHTNQVKDFTWRVRGDGGAREFQLISWGQDNTLRMWYIDPQYQEACGHVPTAASERQKSTAGPSTEKKAAVTKYKSLEQEFNGFTAGLKPNPLANIRFEPNLPGRSCVVEATSPQPRVTLRIQFQFPKQYPNGGQPTIEWLPNPNHTVPTEIRMSILTKLNDKVAEYAKRREPCLDAAVRLMSSEFAVQTSNINNSREEEDGEEGQSQSSEAQDLGASEQPCPRLCGATFSANGTLAFFCNFPRTKFKEETPRYLDILKNALSTQDDDVVGTAETDFTPMKDLFLPSKSEGPTADQRPSQFTISSTVSIVNVSSFIPVSSALGRDYTLRGDSPAAVCRANQAVARAHGRDDLAKTWSLAALITDDFPDDFAILDDTPWAAHPFGSRTAASLLNHYQKEGDVQTVAMLASVFSMYEKRMASVYSNRQKQTAPVTTTTTTTTSPPHNNLKLTTDPSASFLRDRRNRKDDRKTSGSPARGSPDSMSSSSVTEDLMMTMFAGFGRKTSSAQPTPSIPYSNLPNSPSRPASAVMSFGGLGELSPTSNVEPKPMLPNRFRLLDGDWHTRANNFRLYYATILYQWSCFDQRLEMLRWVDFPSAKHQGVDFFPVCNRHQSVLESPVCKQCNRFVLPCAICHVAVKGLSNYCLLCGHGGHAQHMRAWFARETSCPAGCGCQCVTSAS